MTSGVHELQEMVLLSLSIFVFFFAIQRISKVTLERDQYQFLKDICLVAAWGICGVWSPDSTVRLVVAMGLLSAIFGVGQRARPRMPWSLGFFGIGIVFATMGLGISFIGFPGGSYLFLKIGGLLSEGQSHEEYIEAHSLAGELMPDAPSGFRKLDDVAIADIHAWIQAGASDTASCTTP